MESINHFYVHKHASDAAEMNGRLVDLPALSKAATSKLDTLMSDGKATAPRSWSSPAPRAATAAA